MEFLNLDVVFFFFFGIIGKCSASELQPSLEIIFCVDLC